LRRFPQILSALDSWHAASLVVKSPPATSFETPTARILSTMPEAEHIDRAANVVDPI
jgi:hypothetical protein